MPPHKLCRRKHAPAAAAPLFIAVVVVALCPTLIQALNLIREESTTTSTAPAVEALPERQGEKDSGNGGGGWLGRGVDKVYSRLIGECLDDYDDDDGGGGNAVEGSNDSRQQRHQQRRHQQGQCRTDGGVPRVHENAKEAELLEDSCPAGAAAAADDANKEDNFPHTRHNLSRLKQKLYDPLDARGRFALGAISGWAVTRSVYRTVGRLVRMVLLCAAVGIGLAYLGQWDSVDSAVPETVKSFGVQSLASLVRSAAGLSVTSVWMLLSAARECISLGGIASFVRSEAELVAGLVVGGIAGLFV